MIPSSFNSLLEFIEGIGVQGDLIEQQECNSVKLLLNHKTTSDSYKKLKAAAKVSLI